MKAIDQVLLQTAAGAQASVLVGAGNTLAQLRAPAIGAGRNLMHFPDSPEGYAASNDLAGNPLLFPWANRLADSDGYSFADRRISLAGAAGANRPPPYLQDDHGLPLHGCLTKSPDWQTVELDDHTHLARLDWNAAQTARATFACYPFAHTLEMRHTLADIPGGGLTLAIDLSVHNTGDGSMPLSFGFHPYFATGTGPRSEASIDLPLGQLIQTDEHLIPTGALQPLPELWPEHRRLRLRDDLHIDHGFCGLLPDASGDGQQPLVLHTPDHELSVHFGSAYAVAVVYAPARPEPAPFVCFEPMLAPTNALGRTSVQNAAGWPSMPVLAAGQSFTASFTISARPRQQSY